ncbi:unnamed protein product [marine sediment metagenome]|uniref:Uncharacterized protein n=1 Tax=marine sediment metagenome TaxID=412755 RepID=X1NHK3_9ZZZZ
MEERRALNIPPNALLSPKKGGIIINRAGIVIKGSDTPSDVIMAKSSAIPARVQRSPQMKSIGILSIRIRLTAASFDFRPFTAHKTAARINKIESMVTNPIGDFSNMIAAKNKEGMVIMSPAEVIIGEDMLSKSQFLR